MPDTGETLQSGKAFNPVALQVAGLDFSGCAKLAHIHF